YDDEGERLDQYIYQAELIGETVSFEIEKRDQEDNVETKAFELTIVGIVEAPTREWEFNSTVYLSENLFSQFEEFTGTRGAYPYPADEFTELTDEQTYSNVFIHSDSVQHIQDLTAKLTDENYYAYSIASEIKQINMLFNIAKAGLIYIGTIAVLIASI